jgi:repressor LexA
MPTDPRSRILKAIEEFLRHHRYSPAVREIAAAVGLPVTTTYGHLKALRAEGRIRWDPTRNRSIQIISKRSYPPRPPRSKVKVRGEQVAAGEPILADEVLLLSSEQDDAEMLHLPREKVGNGELMLVSIRGDSMTPIVFDDDRIVIRKQETADSGDIVVARITDEPSGDSKYTLKRYRVRNEHIWLVPENPEYEAIDGSHAIIVGKAVALLRRLQ